MTLLTINGIALDVAKSNVSQSHEILGSVGRAQDGSLWSVASARKQSWSARTTPMTESAARAWINLLNGTSDGYGDLITAEDTLGNYTANGRAITLTGATRSTAQYKFGAKSIKIPVAGGPNSIAIQFPWTSANWTAIWWSYVSSWNLSAAGYDGSLHVYNVDGSPACFSYSSGLLTIGEHATDDIYFDQILVLPFCLTSDLNWYAAMALSTTAIPAPPKFYVAGDLFESGFNALVRVGKSSPFDVAGSRYYVLDVEVTEA